MSGTALEHATTGVPTGSPTDSVRDARASLPGGKFESAAAIVVLREGTPLGIVRAERLFAADEAQTLGELIEAGTPIVSADAPEEAVASRIVTYGGSGICVVDARGAFAGFVPAASMLPVLVTQHAKDLARIGGYLAGTRRARSAAEEAVPRRLWHRMPWLLVGLVGAMGSALIVGSFEAELDAKVLLAFFLPAVVYMADAVGTQTETVMIRAFSAGVRARDVLGRELLTGVIAGTIVGVAFLPFALLVWGDADVALAVALALFASCSIATAVAMVLPVVLQRLGVDPAFGSGPLATIAQDLLSIAVYLAIAVPIAG